VTQKDSPARDWKCGLKRVEGSRWQTRGSNYNLKARSRELRLAKRMNPGCQEKPRWGSKTETVPQTDTGRRGENPKALE
jgi:hypothetical protein